VLTAMGGAARSVAYAHAEPMDGLVNEAEHRVSGRLSKSDGFLAQILPRVLDTVFGVQARST
jgi:hypothetical protein